jgi:hypothetical protein
MTASVRQTCRLADSLPTWRSVADACAALFRLIESYYDAKRQH